MSAVLSWLASGVVHGTVALLVSLLLARTLLRHAHPALRAAMWLLVLAQFAFPFGPTFEREVEAVPVVVRVAPAAPVAPSTLPTVLLASWCVVGSLLAAVRVVRAVRARRRLTRGPAVSASVRARLDAWARRLEVRAPPAVEGPGPCVVGLVRPVMVLPPDVDGARLDAMIVHELAHLSRRDAWVQLLQAVVETLFFFWPPVRVASRRLALEREQACDLAVLESGAIGSVDYAHLLVDLSSTNAGLAMAAAPSQLERRINMLLNVKSSRPKWWVLGVLTLLAVAASSKVMDKPTPTPVVIAGDDATVKGNNVSREAVQMVVVAHASELRECYEQLLAKDPGAQGSLSMHFAIDFTGKVQEACMGGEWGGEELAHCVNARVSSWDFPAADFGDQVQVNMPFSFELR
ncbi:MAG: M56 family metallopeptidase [Myxococcaceae bacterium]